jgi:hypothetical protein
VWVCREWKWSRLNQCEYQSARRWARESVWRSLALPLAAHSGEVEVAFDLQAYARVRPTLWHLTHRRNLDLIRESGLLKPTVDMVEPQLSKPRRGRDVQGEGPILRDQDLVFSGAVEFEGGWTMADYLRDLSSRVFFWSGWFDRPVASGRGAAKRYSDSDVVLRVPFLDLAEIYTPYFAACNSGATRMQNGRRVRRGPSTFQPAETCTFKPSNVVEVTFIDRVMLPNTTEVGASVNGPWHLLIPGGG